MSHAGNRNYDQKSGAQPPYALCNLADSGLLDEVYKQSKAKDDEYYADRSKPLL